MARIKGVKMTEEAKAIAKLKRQATKNLGFTNLDKMVQNIHLLDMDDLITLRNTVNKTIGNIAELELEKLKIEQNRLKYKIDYLNQITLDKIIND